MKKIIVAGAGHGGLSCAYLLAKQGIDVTVYEQKAEKDLGWDWHDMMSLTVFDEIGMPPISLQNTDPAIPMTYVSPDKKTKIQLPATTCKTLVYVDRKELIGHLIRQCRAVGVKFMFCAKILSVVTEGDFVTGIRVEKNGKKSVHEADLVVDAAGVDSPVRASLPGSMGIMNTVPDDELIYVYRAYYKRLTSGQVSDPDHVYLMHNNKPGMDWVIIGKDFVDFLVGHFGKTTKQAVNEAIKDFLEEYKEHTDGTLIRGGSFTKIPLTKTMPLFVANGYAAVGDSALMTEPMSGSGISLSIRAGALLARAVLQAGEKELNVQALWRYQYQYLKQYGFRYMGDYRMKCMLAKISPKDINTFLNKKIIGETELKHNGLSGTPKRELPKKLLDSLPLAHCLPAVIPFVTGGKKTQAVKKALPAKYDKQRVNEWVKAYQKL